MLPLTPIEVMKSAKKGREKIEARTQEEDKSFDQKNFDQQRQAIVLTHIIPLLFTRISARGITR